MVIFVTQFVFVIKSWILILLMLKPLKLYRRSQRNLFLSLC